MRFPEEFRWKDAPNGFQTKEGDRFGAFRIPASQATGRTLSIIAADGEGTDWDHVSISLPDTPKKCPSWDEMCIVKRLFWSDDACVVQFHPPASEYVNDHVGVLHLWRSLKEIFPLPPKVCV
jgi:hypothetical protein